MINGTVDYANLKVDVEDIEASSMNILRHLVTASLVFFMQAGFALLEAGTVKSKNAVNILFKTLIDGGISAFTFWLLGYGFAFGETWEGFIGKSNFARTGLNRIVYSLWTLALIASVAV
jgi:ammonia channel protein AmtB